MNTSARRTLNTSLADAEIQKFADAKLLAGAACPRCAVKDWEYTDETLSHQTLGLNIIDSNNHASGLFATIVFNCRNCGFVAAHAKNIVVDWLNNHE